MKDERTFLIRHSEIASEAMFGPITATRISPPVVSLAELTATYDALVSPSQIYVLYSLALKCHHRKLRKLDSLVTTLNARRLGSEEDLAII